jgi:histidine triad (HIT) family protein
MVASIFTKIIAGEIPCYKIAENSHCIAFLDIRPIAKGHVLVVPKIQIDYIFDIDDETLTNLMQFTKSVAKGIEKSVPCKRVGVAIIGLEVPHAHIHLIPISGVHDIDFSKEPISMTKDEFYDLAELIQSNVLL